MLKILIVFIVTTLALNAELIRNEEQKIIIDTKTNLVWLDPKEVTDVEGIFGYKMYWSDAKSYCSSLNHAGYRWFLPNINQLSSLIDRNYVSPATSPVLKDIISDRKYTTFWSSTASYDTIATDIYHKEIWSVNFYGEFSHSNSIENYISIQAEYSPSRMTAFFLCVGFAN